MEKDEGEETPTFVVVGMNRPRLKKIMGMVEELKVERMSKEEESKLLKTEFVPCVASMGQYEGEDGQIISYLMNVSHLDGSTMKDYLDDEKFRSNLIKILLVGYEWNDSNAGQVKTFFITNNLDVEFKCVEANSGFDSLAAEMDFFKQLNEDDKKAHLSDRTMGPGKMAEFIISESLDGNIAEEETAEVTTEELVEDTIPEEPPKPAGPTINPELPRYACRMCRTPLFGEDCLASNHVQNLHSFKRANFNAKRPTQACQSIFCSDVVLDWLAPAGTDIEGRLECPKCAFKLGHWKWSGAQCSCGTWVTPAIQIPASKVDKVLPTASRTINSVLHPSMVVNSG